MVFKLFDIGRVAHGDFERLGFELEAKDFGRKRRKEALKQQLEQMMLSQLAQRRGLI